MQNWDTMRTMRTQQHPTCRRDQRGFYSKRLHDSRIGHVPVTEGPRVVVTENWLRRKLAVRVLHVQGDAVVL